MMQKEEHIIALSNATIGYKGNSNSLKIVKSGISVHALKGELVALIGGNGVGKSTLLRTIAGFQPPVGGDILINGAPVSSYKEKELALIMSFVSTEIIRVPNLSVLIWLHWAVIRTPIGSVKCLMKIGPLLRKLLHLLGLRGMKTVWLIAFRMANDKKR